MKFYFECDEFLKYLYSNEIEKVENDTAIDKWDATISKTTWQKWRALNIEHLDENRINALNEKGSAKIATFQDIERLCEIIKMDVSTPNAKRVFNMLISADPDLKYVASDKKTDAKKTPLAMYMEHILNVDKSVYYLPGRSVDLSILCNYGKQAERIQPRFKAKGILAGLKVLVGLGLVEAFEVVNPEPDVYEAKPILKEDITAHKNIIYRLSVKGCTNYIKKAEQKQGNSSE